jgi:hypothetical protein
MGQEDPERSTFLDALWDRMRENAEAEGRTRADVDQIIDEVRGQEQ